MGIEVALLRGANHTRQRLLGAGSGPHAIAPHTFRATTARIAGSARRLVASIVGSNKKDHIAGNS